MQQERNLLHFEEILRGIDLEGMSLSSSIYLQYNVASLHFIVKLLITVILQTEFLKINLKN
jgi:hypothetical protein